MKKSDIYEIAIKILGLYLFFSSIDLLTTVLATIAALWQAKQNPESFGTFEQMPFVILSIVNFVLVVVFALLFTLKTKSIVRLVCSPTEYEEKSFLFAERKVIYEMALVLMGLVVIVWTLPDLLINLRQHVHLVQNDIPTDPHNSNFLIASAIKIVFGALAVFYANSISSLLINVNK